MADFDIENLLKKIKDLEAELKTAKKYGLVQDKENTKEEVVLQCEKYIPIFEMNQTKLIEKGQDNNILIESHYEMFIVLCDMNFETYFKEMNVKELEQLHFKPLNVNIAKESDELKTYFKNMKK